FGAIFVLLQVAGTLAESALGHFGFYAVSLIGGFVSSASAVASAATLAAQGRISAEMGGAGAALASVASVATHVVLVGRVSRRPELARQAGLSLLAIALVGIAAVVLQALLLPAYAAHLVPPRG